jgi:hypothetical protein
MKRIILALVLTSVVTAAYGDDQLVTPGNLGDWTLGTTDATGTLTGGAGDVAAIVNGPATPPVGPGSVQLTASPGDDGAFASTTQLNGLPLADLTSLSYSTYVTSNNGQQFPYIQISVSDNGGTTPTDVLTFEPPYQTLAANGNSNLPDQGATQLNEWQTWNAQTGGWYWGNSLGGDGQEDTLADYLAANPDATIVANSPYFPGGITFLSGYADPTLPDNGYIDDVTIGTTTGTTTFDFEATPEPSSVVLGAVALLAFLGLRRRFAPGHARA